MAPNFIAGADGEYLLAKDAKPIVARQAPESCPTCGGKDLIQDPDVLDTWFSSGFGRFRLWVGPSRPMI